MVLASDANQMDLLTLTCIRYNESTLNIKHFSTQYYQCIYVIKHNLNRRQQSDTIQTPSFFSFNHDGIVTINANVNAATPNT